jgi:hypothetical protein
VAFRSNSVHNIVSGVPDPTYVPTILVHLHIECAQDLDGPRKHGSQLRPIARSEHGQYGEPGPRKTSLQLSNQISALEAG